MSNIIRYTIDTAWTSDATLITNLEGLTTGSTAIGSAITNATNFDLLGDLSIELASITTSGSPYFEVHVVPLLGDGSTYADFFAAGPTLVQSIAVTTGASAKSFIAGGMILPPGTFKFGIVDQTGATLSATAPSAYYRLYTYNLNG